jgi:AbrB family looped-hinge helix DNA binding protein
MTSVNSSVLTRKGQVTIPAEFRDALGLKEGDRLVWWIENGHLTVTSARAYMQQLGGMLKPLIDPTMPSPTLDEMDDAINAGWTEGMPSRVSQH